MASQLLSAGQDMVHKVLHPCTLKFQQHNLGILEDEPLATHNVILDTRKWKKYTCITFSTLYYRIVTNRNIIDDKALKYF